MKQNEFVEYVTKDLLAELTGVTSRAMFGGYGIYKDGIIFGMIVDDELYLKVDDTNKKEYQKMGSTPFTYKSKEGKEISMSYWKISGEILEDRERLTDLADISYNISKKLALDKGKKGKKK